MRKRRSNKLDPVERQIEIAVRPGELILDRACFSFVTGLEAVGAEIDKITLAEPPRAVALYETFLAGCHAKADQLDDSSGYFSQFVHNVICRWIKARQASGIAVRTRLKSERSAFQSESVLREINSSRWGQVRKRGYSR